VWSKVFPDFKRMADPKPAARDLGAGFYYFDGIDGVFSGLKRWGGRPCVGRAPGGTQLFPVGKGTRPNLTSGKRGQLGNKRGTFVCRLVPLDTANVRGPLGRGTHQLHFLIRKACGEEQGIFPPGAKTARVGNLWSIFLGFGAGAAGDGFPPAGILRYV